MSDLAQITTPMDHEDTQQRTHGGSSHELLSPKHASHAPEDGIANEQIMQDLSAPHITSPNHQSPTTIIQKNSTQQHAKSQDINSDTENESTQDRPPSPRSPSDTPIKVIKEPLQPDIELPEQQLLGDRSPIHSPSDSSLPKDTLKNLNSKRQLPDSIPTELDYKKIKRNELLMNETNEKHANRILSKLLKDPWAPPFEAPVDPISLNLPDYFDIIKRPMDLGTIDRNLNEKKYPTVSSFGDDVRLVFNNAKLYNSERSDIHKAARNFLRDFEDLMRSTAWDQAYDTKIPEVTTPIIAISKASTKPTPTRTEVTHIEEPRSTPVAISGSPPSPPLPIKSEKSRNGSHPRSGGSKHGYNCLVYYQNETIPYDFEWQQLHSREDFEQRIRSSLNIPSMVDLEIGIKRSKPNFGREIFVQLSPRWEEFPRVSCVLVKHKKQ